jgi:hypothetical protein
VFHKTKHGNTVIDQGVREILGLMAEGVAGRRTKLHNKKVHDL